MRLAGLGPKFNAPCDDACACKRRLQFERGCLAIWKSDIFFQTNSPFIDSIGEVRLATSASSPRAARPVINVSDEQRRGARVGEAYRRHTRDAHAPRAVYADVPRAALGCGERWVEDGDGRAAAGGGWLVRYKRDSRPSGDDSETYEQHSCEAFHLFCAFLVT